MSGCFDAKSIFFPSDKEPNILAEIMSITQEIELGCYLTYIKLGGHKSMTL